MFGKSIELFTLFGFKIKLDWSWFVIALLFTWSLAGYFPSLAPDLTPTVYWSMGAIGALGLFVSVVLHELGHALVARRYGVSIRGITLFIFGGVAELEGEPPHPRSELLIALAGPAVSLLLGGAGLGLRQLAEAQHLSVAVTAVVGYLGGINVLLAIFNMIPAFPLDGGRVLRAILWSTQGSLRRATRTTSKIGAGFGAALILFGIFRVIAWSDWVGGMWMFLIGMFLRGAAQGSYQQLLLRNALTGEPVRRFMKTDPITVPRSISVRELVEEYVYRHHFKLFPVVDNGRLVGCVTTRRIRELPSDEWERTSVGALADACGPDNTTGPEDDTLEALTKMSRGGLSRLMVVEGDQLLGILALKDLLQFLALKVELEGGGGDPDDRHSRAA